MKFNIIDLRKNQDKLPKHAINVFFNNNLKEEVVIVGHSTDGIELYGLTSTDIIPNEGVYMLWLYCCHSANDLCPKLAARGYLTIGYIRKILSFTNRIPLEVEYVENSIISFKEKNSIEVEKEIKDTLFDCAREQIKIGEFLLAAILNYNRLSMKAFKK